MTITPLVFPYPAIRLFLSKAFWMSGDSEATVVPPPASPSAGQDRIAGSVRPADWNDGPCHDR